MLSVFIEKTQLDSVTRRHLSIQNSYGHKRCKWCKLFCKKKDSQCIHV